MGMLEKYILMSKQIAIPDEVVMNKIFLVRGQKVMLDRDLAELYGVKAIRLREQVKRDLRNCHPESIHPGTFNSIDHPLSFNLQWNYTRRIILCVKQ